MIQSEVVERQRWLTDEEFGSLYGLCFLFPGLTQCKLAAMIGLHVSGYMGVLVAVLALNIPGLVLAAACYGILSRPGVADAPAARRLMLAMRYGAVTMLAAALTALSRPLLPGGQSFSPAAGVLALVMFIAVAYYEVATFTAMAAYIVASFVIL